MTTVLQSPSMHRAQVTLRRFACLLLIVGTLVALAHWQFAARRDQPIAIADAIDQELFSGFHAVEISSFLNGRAFRWTEPTLASIRMDGLTPGTPALFSIWLSVPQAAQSVTVQFCDLPTTDLAVTPQIRRYRLLVPPRADCGAADFVVQLRSAPYPAGEGRPLGVVVWQAARTQLGTSPWPGAAAELLIFPQTPLAALLLTLAARNRLRAAAATAALGLALPLLDQLLPLRGLTISTFALLILAALLLATLLARVAPALPAVFSLRTDRSAVRWLALGAVLLIVLTFEPVVRADGNGYFAYLRTLIFDGDLNMTDEFDRLYGYRYLPLTPDGLMPNPWAIGPAIVWLPLYLAAHGVAVWAGDVTVDGYSEPYRVAVTIASALSLLLTLFATYRIARRWVSPSAAALGAAAMLLGSPLWYYAVRLGSFAHALSAAAAALMLLAWLRYEERPTTARAVQLGLSAGALVLMYTACAVLLAGPALTMLQRLVRARRDAAALRRLLWHGLLIAGCVLLVFTPQMLVWLVTYGRLLVKPVTSPSLTAESHLLDVLFSPGGLLWWTPALLLGLLAPLLLRRAPRLLWAGLLIGSWGYVIFNAQLDSWHADDSFGMRRLTVLAPWAGLGLALLSQQLLNAGRRFWAALLPIAAGGWMLLVMVRYDLRLFARDVRSPLELLDLSLSELVLRRSLAPVWEIPGFIGTSYFGRALQGEQHEPSVLFALLTIAAALALSWVVSGRLAPPPAAHSDQP